MTEIDQRTFIAQRNLSHRFASCLSLSIKRRPIKLRASFTTLPHWSHLRGFPLPLPSPPHEYLINSTAAPLNLPSRKGIRWQTISNRSQETTKGELERLPWGPHSVQPICINIKEWPNGPRDEREAQEERRVASPRAAWNTKEMIRPISKTTTSIIRIRAPQTTIDRVLLPAPPDGHRRRPLGTRRASDCVQID